MAKALPVAGLIAEAETRINLPLVFGARVQELWSWDQHVRHAERVQELHDMRISAKRLRYCLEFFSGCLGRQFKDTLAKFKKLQDYLGEIHDCDVWLERLADEVTSTLRILRKLPRELHGNSGQPQALLNAIGAVRDGFNDPVAHGLLLLMEDVVARRSLLYSDFVTYWNELEQQDFRGELSTLVAQASRSGEAELGRVSQN
jgi:hypothetical protein